MPGCQFIKRDPVNLNAIAIVTAIGKIDIHTCFIFAGVVQKIIETLNPAFFLKRFAKNKPVALFTGVKIGNAVAFGTTFKNRP